MASDYDFKLFSLFLLIRYLKMWTEEVFVFNKYSAA